MNNNITENHKFIDEKIIKAMNENLLPGLVVGIIQDGKLVHTRGYGFANVDQKQPITADTVFRIASISKTFTAIGLMQLWEQGKFDLDDPVNEYLKVFKILHRDPNAPPVTIRHMLTHRAGIGEGRSSRDLLLMVVQMMGGKSPSEFDDEAKVPGMGEYVKGRLEIDAYPGQKWAYANYAFGSLGQLIEDISGEPFPEYMRRHVFEPLGMETTSYRLTDTLRSRLATGYKYKKGHMFPTKITFFPDMGAGSVSSSVDEMALYMAALMNDGNNEHGRVLKPETLKLMMTAHYREHARLGAMGLSFFLNDEDGHLFASHGGTLDGYESEVVVAPQDKLGVLLWTNKNTLALTSLGDGILRRLLGLEDVARRIPAKNILMPTHVWQELVGSYGPLKGFNSNARIWMILGGEAVVYVKDNHLMLRGLIGPLRKGVALTPVDPNDPLLFESLVFEMPLRLIFKRNTEGFVDCLSMTIMMFFTLYKRRNTQSVRFKANLLLSALAALGAGIIGLVYCRKKRK